MKMLMLPRYGRMGASSRLRSYQYVPYFEQQGFEVEYAPLLGDAYLRRIYRKEWSLRSVLSGYASRIGDLIKGRSFDIIYTEKELLPWLPAICELGLLSSGARLVVDYDDAVFHRYDQNPSFVVRKILGNKLDWIMRRANLVTVGNDYLGDRARRAGSRRIEKIPTVVDLERYPVRTNMRPTSGSVVIGWIGSPITAPYLQQIAAPLERLRRRHDITCVAIGARPDQLVGTPFVAREWSEEAEASLLGQFDIGVMPLPDAPWERGKCGYKIVQYMASALPVVASPVGVNVELLDHGRCGSLASSPEEWEEALDALITDDDARARCGQCGRNQVESYYSLQTQGPRLARLLADVAR